MCCCNDCQAFVQFLRPDQTSTVLDEFGGTEIYQTSLAQVHLDKGQDLLRSMRLTPGGLLRWYTDCCRTPVGNTMSVKMPFVGVVHSFMDADEREHKLGPVLAWVQVQHAIGEPDYPRSAQKFPAGITLRMIRKLLAWKMRGMNRPSVFFDDNGKPVSAPTVAG